MYTVKEISTLAGVSVRTKEKFDAMHPALTDFFREAVEVYVDNQQG